jgi:uncharacterized phage protein (TIGR01671 family)
MRKIKFRVFDKGLKIIHYLDGKDPHDDLNFFDGNVYYYNLQNGCGSMGDDSGYVLMQFTGLLDKNGEEIYEGDIIKSETSHPLEIFWMGIAWGIRFTDFGNVEEEIICDDGGDMTFEKGDRLPYMEVIGNIYDNPLLIN